MFFSDAVRRIASRVRTGPRVRFATLALIVPLLFLSISAAPLVDATPDTSTAFRYSVRSGDSLWKIAVKYDTTVHDLVQANRIKDPDLIFPGQVIWVPASGQQNARASTQAVKAAAKYVFPIKEYHGTVRDHWGSFKYHEGAADLLVAEGTRIYAVTSGKVINAGRTKLGGWNMMIQGDDGRLYYYAHFRQAAVVEAGEYVTAGQHIAYVGNTGNSASPHLHIAIGRQITTAGNAEGYRGGYGVDFNVPDFLNKIH